MKRAALGSSVVALLALLLVWAPSATAHTDLLFSTPDDGAVLAEAPTEVVLTFSEELLPEAVKVSVQDAAGVVVTIGDPKVDGSDVTATWPPGVVGPDFTVNYRVVSADGHPVTGSIGFTVTADPVSPAGATSADATVAAAPASSAPVPVAATVAEPEPSRAPLLAIGVGLAVGIGVGFFFVVRARRGSTS